MWLLDTPKNYQEMIKKIPFGVFGVVFIGLALFSYTYYPFYLFLKSISFNLSFNLLGYNIDFANLYIPFAISFIERIFKFHDKVSDFFGIRYKFDKEIIIREFIKEMKLDLSLSEINKENRSNILYGVFYKYVDGTNPSIELHPILMALDSWTWYWIFFDSLLVISFMSVIWITIDFSLGNIGTSVIIIGLILILLYFIKKDCTKYAQYEVRSILRDQTRRMEIKEYLLNALSNQQLDTYQI